MEARVMGDELNFFQQRDAARREERAEDVRRFGPDWPGQAKAREERENSQRHGDVMAELQDHVSENSGLWSAARAAEYDRYVDPQDPTAAAFYDETGVGAAQDAYNAAQQAMTAELAAGGAYSAEQYAASLQTGADLSHALTDADGMRNRYQQTTDFGNADYVATTHQSIDDSLAADLDNAAANPDAYFIGWTADEAGAYAQEQWDAAQEGAPADAGADGWG